MKKVFNSLYYSACWIVLFPFLLLMSICARLFRIVRKSRKPRLLWAGAPMPSLMTASTAMVNAGYDSISIVNQLTSNNNPKQFDVMLLSKKRVMKGLNTPLYLTRTALSFTQSMFQRDILHSFFTGGILGNTPLIKIEPFLWKLSGGKHIVFPYGQDGFIYSSLPDMPWAKALKTTYPRTNKQDLVYAKRVKKLSKTADCVIGCMVHTACLPRIDVWPTLWYPAPKIDIKTNKKINDSNALKIAHPTNHRDIKGTDSLIQAVEDLKTEGLNISLDIIEGVDINTSRSRMKQADIVVDQLLMGYAMTALEGMALGKIVISGFDNNALYKPFYENSYLSECPILRASPATIKDILKQLYENPQHHDAIKAATKIYCETYHSEDACVTLFETVYEAIETRNYGMLAKLYLQPDGTQLHKKS